MTPEMHYRIQQDRLSSLIREAEEYRLARDSVNQDAKKPHSRLWSTLRRTHLA
ncbi:hypothetical protein [Rhizohabitans arisaemae]|uniref:hypothetical protein n=1 Tax=Rhizohabitans arisaemae TaxID=2720610 RepID=UPI0024B175AC|nr:hypothetical protein [Rhizohabitans arisaemae]